MYRVTLIPVESVDERAAYKGSGALASPLSQGNCATALKSFVPA